MRKNIFITHNGEIYKLNCSEIEFLNKILTFLRIINY